MENNTTEITIEEMVDWLQSRVNACDDSSQDILMLEEFKRVFRSYKTKDEKETSNDIYFEAGLAHLINEHSQENGSDTPDFILAEYLRRCLDNFDATVNDREQWYGRKTEKENINVKGD